MKIKILISKKIIDQFGIDITSWVVNNNINHQIINDFPHYLTDENILDQDTCYLAIGIHSMHDYPKQFCVHPCGNWGELWSHKTLGDLGGEPKTLSMSSATLLKATYLALRKNNTSNDYKVNIECTHHGPSITKPILFLEIGCSNKEWSDPYALQVLQQTILDVNNILNAKTKTTIVLGGEHYMPNVQHLLQETNIQVSHMCPSTQLHTITKESIQEAIKKSYEPIDMFIIDLEGVGQYKEQLINLLDELNQPYVFMHELL